MDDEKFVAGASASLNKSIQEVTDLLNDVPMTGQVDLRSKLNKLISQLAYEWAEYGFKLAHKECDRNFAEHGDIPATLVYDDGMWDILDVIEGRLKSRIIRKKRA